MRRLISILFLLLTYFSFAQKEFHVFPKNANNIKGSSTGDGSLNKPWDLQTALSQSSQRVNGGDIIWLHKGVYNGRFTSTLNSNNQQFITVSAYKNDLVVLNGNVESKENQVLKINGNKVIFKNFEVTNLGDFSRNVEDENFRNCAGINHLTGEAKFQNLKIYNNPGLGFGSWKNTGGSIIEDCMIYFNGYIGKKRGNGEGMYVQNRSDETRIIRNNIIFGNYYKGIEVWSASKGHDYHFVKHVTLEDNIFFNNGQPSGVLRDNLIVATNDTRGTNVAKHIKVLNNVFYHNIDFNDNKNYGTGVGMAIGFKANARVEDITIINNIILGRNNALNLMHVNSLNFNNNTVYSGYINFYKSSLKALQNGNFSLDNNSYYTRKNQSHRVIEDKKYTLSDWQNTFNTDQSSQWKTLNEFSINPVLKISKFRSKKNQYHVALLQKNGEDVKVDFGVYDLDEGMGFKIYDLENRTEADASGKVPKNGIITFPMGLTEFQKPLHNTIAVKSADNFGAFRIVFEEAPKKKGLFQRLLGWLF